jgi:cell division protein FtsW
MSATVAEKRPTVGRLLRSARELQPRTTNFKVLWFVVIAANLFGLLMILSASSVTALYQYGTSWYQFRLQALWFVIGCCAMFFMSRYSYEKLSKWMKLILFGSAGLMVAVLIPGLGVSVNGSSRWIGWGPLRMQPSEFVKLAVILYAADTLTRRVGQIRDWKAVLRPIAIVFVAFAAMLMAQPNLGTTIILATIVLVMLFVGGVPAKPLALFSGLLVGGALFFAVTEPYRWRRLMSFRDPWADPLYTGYQSLQSQVGFANGGVLGTGLGQGRAKWGFLPEAHTDFIYAIIGEEIGLVGSVLVIGVFLAFALLGIRTALHARDRFGMLLATGITTWILIQAFINVGACVGVLPITGVPLPFVSAGGSSLVVTMAASGILLNIARQGR